MAPPATRIEPRLLVLFLLIGLVPALVGHLFLASGAREALTGQLEQQAGRRAADIQRDLVDLIESSLLQVSNLAASPVVRATALEAARISISPQRLEEEIADVESQWPQLRGDAGMLYRILADPASQFLRLQNAVQGTLREILVTDVSGRLIAATNKTSDYFQGDEPWWEKAFREGMGASYVGDLVFDESANSYGMEIAEPIRDPDSGAVIGVVKAILDSPALFSHLEDANYGTSERTLLVRPDGTVVWAPDGSLRFPYEERLRAAVEQGRRSLSYSGADHDLIVGLPPSGIDARIAELRWYVIVELDRDLALAPLRRLDSRFFLIVGVTFVAILLGALVFSRMLSRPAVEIDPHFEELA